MWRANCPYFCSSFGKKNIFVSLASTSSGRCLPITTRSRRSRLLSRPRQKAREVLFSQAGPVLAWVENISKETLREENDSSNERSELARKEIRGVRNELWGFKECSRWQNCYETLCQILMIMMNKLRMGSRQTEFYAFCNRVFCLKKSRVCIKRYTWRPFWHFDLEIANIPR